MIELIVVVAIISILAALLMPGLKIARDSARSTVCMNNLKQIGAACHLYANDYEGWTPSALNPPSNKTWNELLAIGYLPAPQVGQATVFLCPAQSPRIWDGSAAHAYGMRILSTGSLQQMYDSKYNIGSAAVVDAENNDFGPPAGFLLLGDSVLNNWADPNEVRKQRYFFLAYNAGPPANSVHLRHHGKGNFLFGDGHVAALARSDLVGKQGRTDGAYAFIAESVDESKAD
ncbi:MAG: DUF1559 domain-containing protein [Verrucomicrobia bacterium]|nr:DUF1559 domain-containing protein [Verrucomicrobiota bacterium]